MKPYVEERSLAQTPPEASSAYHVKEENLHLLLSLVRDKMYSDKILAVVREYGTNAVDAHIEAGKPDLPFVVQLPTSLDPIFRVRDFGPGLSREEIFDVYASYGESTKRESNEVMGAFGLGAKSGFAYVDQFQIISWHEGVRSVYNAVIDESNVGRIDLIYSEKSDESSGIEIHLPVDPNDVYAFQRKAEELYMWFDPLPKVEGARIKLEPPELGERVEGGIRLPGRPGVHVRVGCIVYPIDLGEIYTEAEEEEQKLPLSQEFQHEGLLLLTEIGEIDLIPSREKLEYTSRTKKTLRERLDALLSAFTDLWAQDLAKASCDWQRRQTYSMLPNWGRVRLGPDWRWLGQSPSLKFYVSGLVSGEEESELRELGRWPAPKLFRFLRVNYKGQTEPAMRLDAESLVLWDIKAPYKSKELRPGRIMVVPYGKKWEPQTTAELNHYLGLLRVVGIPKERASTLADDTEYLEKKKKRAKYGRSLFLLTKTPRWGGWGSSVWVPLSLDEQEDLPDNVVRVGTIIRRFEPDDMQFWGAARAIAKYRGEKIQLVGLRYTERKPQTREDLPVMSAKEYVETFIEQVAGKRAFKRALWAREKQELCLNRYESKKLRPVWEPHLDEGHPLLAFLSWLDEPVTHERTKTSLLVQALASFWPDAKAAGWSGFPCHIERAYPLIGLTDGWRAVLSSREVVIRHWAEYMKLCDDKRKGGAE